MIADPATVMADNAPSVNLLSTSTDLTDMLGAFALYGGTEARRRGFLIADADLFLAARDEILRLRDLVGDD